MSDSLQPHGLYSPWNSPGQNTGVGQPFPFPGDLPNSRIKPRSPTLQVDSLPAELQGKPVDLKLNSKLLDRYIGSLQIRFATRPYLSPPTTKRNPNPCSYHSRIFLLAIVIVSLLLYCHDRLAPSGHSWCSCHVVHSGEAFLLYMLTLL